jgi:predicted transcriptional regulator
MPENQGAGAHGSYKGFVNSNRMGAMNMHDHKMFVRIFQHRLRIARERVHISQARLATALGVSEENYKKYEKRPRSTLPVSHIVKFAAITGTKERDLLNPVASRTEIDILVEEGMVSLPCKGSA